MLLATCTDATALVVLNRNRHMKPYSGATETQKHVASYNMPHYTITYAVINACTLAIPASTLLCMLLLLLYFLSFPIWFYSC